jgi:hypothetical protein
MAFYLSESKQNETDTINEINNNTRKIKNEEETKTSL